jgi:hypothetical protein
MCAATIDIGGKVRRIEEREDGLWYLANPQDQAELGSQGKPYLAWYEQSDFARLPRPKSTMCYS